MSVEFDPTPPDKDELRVKRTQLEDENKRLWDELREKRARIVALDDKLLLQQNLLKSQAELKKLLHEYLGTIRALQKSVVYLQRENKLLEAKFYRSQLAAGQLRAAGVAGVAPDQQRRRLARENFALRMRLHALDKEMRRCMQVWEANVDVSAEAVAARETCAQLERQLLDCRPAVAEREAVRAQLAEAEARRGRADLAAAALRDELRRSRAALAEAAERGDRLRAHAARCARLATRMREQRAAAERFVEKSFRLEGALAELDDLSVTLRKQETMMAALFDENQALKEGIGHLFDDVSALKDRNWKLERYVGDVERQFWAAEKGAVELERRVEYLAALRAENEALRRREAEGRRGAERLEVANRALATKLAEAETRARGLQLACGRLEEEKRALAAEALEARERYASGGAKLVRENEFLRGECEKQRAAAARYAQYPAELKAAQKKLAEAQEAAYRGREELRRLADENRFVKEDLSGLEYKVTTMRADREHDLRELKEMRAKVKQLEYELGVRDRGDGFNRY